MLIAYTTYAVFGADEIEHLRMHSLPQVKLLVTLILMMAQVE